MKHKSQNQFKARIIGIRCLWSSAVSLVYLRRDHRKSIINSVKSPWTPTIKTPRKDWGMFFPKTLWAPFQTKPVSTNIWKKTCKLRLYPSNLIQYSQYYLPPYTMVTSGFLKQILAGEKKLLKMSEAKTCNPPRYDEVSVTNLYTECIELEGMKDYFPDEYPKGR